MKLNYAHQRILITGASAGIGRDMARLLAARGAKALILVARRQDALEALKREIQAEYPAVAVHVCPCDLSDLSAIDDLLKLISREVGAVDILINNAGMGDYGLFENADWNKLERMLRLNVEALTYLTYKLVPPMIALGRGAVLNISSGFGMFFMPGMSVYAATKHYVTAFTEALRGELRGTGVIVSQACPGPVATEFGDVAGTSESIPGPIMMPSEACAREILDGFARGRALVIPGLLISIGTNLGRLVPRPLLRLALSPMRKRLLKEPSPRLEPVRNP